MEIKLLAIKRKEDFPGQFLPEIISVVDETTMDQNPEWWGNEVAKELEEVGDDLTSHTILKVVLDEDQIEKALHPTYQIDSHMITQEEESNTVEKTLRNSGWHEVNIEDNDSTEYYDLKNGFSVLIPPK